MRIRDVQLHVQIDGEGTPLLWSHGLMSSIATDHAVGDIWRETPDGIRLVRYDARGHGRSGASAAAADYASPSLALDMLALADAVAEPRVHPTPGAAAQNRFIAGGWSLACVSAIHAAVLAPQRFKGLILMLPPRIWEARAAQSRLYRIAARLGPALAKASGGIVLPEWLAEAEPERVRLAAAGAAGIAQATLSLLFQGAAMSDLPPREQLARLAGVPALVIGWEGDPTHPVDSARALHRLLPGSALHIASNLAQWEEIPGRIRAFAAGCA